MTAPLSREAIARFLKRPDAPRVVNRRASKHGAIGPRNRIRIAAERLGRFTTEDLAKATGKRPFNCRTTVGIMQKMGLVRKVVEEASQVAVYRRLDGGDMSGRVRNEGARLIEAMAPGHTFTRADLPGTSSQINEAVLKARKCRMIERISPRQTHAVWEVVK